jgi:hypothetical protein
MDVTGGSTASVVFSAALRTTAGAPVPALASKRSIDPTRDSARRRTTARSSRAPAPAAAAGRRDPTPLERREQRRDQRLAFAGGDHVGKERKRLRVHERHRAADHHQRIVVRALVGAQGDAGEPQDRQDVRVVPLERHREGENVEVADERLRFDRHERRARLLEGGHFALGRQEGPLAHDPVLGVEQTVDRLEAEVGHADEVGVGKHQRDAQAAGVRFAHVADLLGQEGLGLFTLLPLTHRSSVLDRGKSLLPLAFGL